MAQDFPGLPEDIYEYENGFNYSVWTPNTSVVMCNVPWDSSYRDIVRFDTDSERDAYFASRSSDGYSFTLNGLVYLRYGEPVRVNAPFDMVTRCNYMVVRNPLQPVPPSGRRTPDTFYYFVSDAKYIAPNTTQVNVQLDVWMTYGSRVVFDMCYVNKGHIGIANSNSTLGNLSEYLTDTEGLNIGDEYEVVHQEYMNFAEEAPWIMFMCSADLEGDWGTVGSPNLSASSGTIAGGMIQGCGLYAASSQNFLIVLRELSNAPWISQCISYMTVVPRKLIEVNEAAPVKVGQSNTPVYRLEADTVQPFAMTVDGTFDKFHIPSRYRNLLKFYTSPYTAIEATYQNGGEIVLKPECLRVDVSNAQTMEFEVLSSPIPPSVRAAVVPKDYNRSPGIGDVVASSYNGAGFRTDAVLYGGEGLDMALVITNFPQLSVTNNMYAYYMASTVNARNYQFAAADWSQQKALTAAQLSFDQSGANMQNAWANQQVANQANWALSGISQEKNIWGGATSMLSSGAGALGNAASGNMGAAMSDVANTALAGANMVMNADWIGRTTAAQVGAATASTRNNIGLQDYMRNTNYDYAVYAANGDYETAIQSIQAKVQDAKLTQPTTSGQNGGDFLNAAHGYFGVLLKWKRLKPNFMRQVGDFWLRYGYYVNRWLVPPADLKCMENFTYWKMQSVALRTSEVPELFKETIRGIFEKGVTVWNDPDKMYRIDLADNEPVKGVGY
jgi:hypothetical protein